MVKALNINNTKVPVGLNTFQQRLNAGVPTINSQTAVPNRMSSPIQTASQVQAPSIRPIQAPTPVVAPQVNIKPTPFSDRLVGTKPLSVMQQQKPMTVTESKINDIYKTKLPTALENVKKNANPIEQAVQAQDFIKIASNTAKSQAISEYLANNSDESANPEIIKMQQDIKKSGSETSKQIKQNEENTKASAQAADFAASITPVIGNAYGIIKGSVAVGEGIYDLTTNGKTDRGMQRLRQYQFVDEKDYDKMSDADKQRTNTGAIIGSILETGFSLVGAGSLIAGVRASGSLVKGANSMWTLFKQAPKEFFKKSIKNVVTSTAIGTSIGSVVGGISDLSAGDTVDTVIQNAWDRLPNTALQAFKSALTNEFANRFEDSYGDLAAMKQTPLDTSPQVKDVKDAMVDQMMKDNPALDRAAVESAVDKIADASVDEMTKAAITDITNQSKTAKVEPTAETKVETTAPQVTKTVSKVTQPKYTPVDDIRQNSLSEVRVVKNSDGKYQLAFKDENAVLSTDIYNTVDEAFNSAKLHNDGRVMLNSNIEAASKRYSPRYATKADADAAKAAGINAVTAPQVTKTPQQEIADIYNHANKSRGGKLTMTEESRIAELQGKSSASTQVKQAEPITVREVNPDGTVLADSQQVHFPSDENINSYRTKKAEATSKGSGYVSDKSDIIRTDMDGNEIGRISYDKAVKNWGTEDRTVLANKLVNGDAPATPQVTKTPTPTPTPTPKKAEAEVIKPIKTPKVTKPVETLAPIKKPVVKATPVVDETATVKSVKNKRYIKVTPDETTTAKTGEIGKSKTQIGGAKGQKYQKTSRAASKGRGLIEAEKTTYDDFVSRAGDKAAPTAQDRDTALALQKNYERGTHEWKQLGKIAGRGVTEAAKILGTQDRNVRKTASAEQITDKFANEIVTILDDDRVVTKEDFKPVEQKNREFEVARNNKENAYNKFQADPSDANMKAFEKANDDYIKADTASLFEEYNVLGKAIKRGKTKNTDAKAYLDKLRENTGIYFMDYVDTNMLSSTRTMINNYINSMTVSLEESVFGKPAAAIARKLVPGSTVGGGSSVGRKLGKKLGWQQTKTEYQLRNKAFGNKFLNKLSNLVTTGNTLGDRNISATVYSAVVDAYRNDLSQKGYTGVELNNRAKVEAIADPKGLVEQYRNEAMANMGLAGGLNMDAKAKMKIETNLSDKISGMLSSVLPSKIAKTVAKVLVRTTIGFPTVAVRSAVGGVKRTLLGTVSAGQAVKSALTKGSDPNITAMHIKNSIKEAGSGATMMAIGVGLASQGLISGGYPDDKDEQEAWKRESKSEYSIKLGSHWYNLPQALGVFALPFMVGANAMDNVKEGKSITEDIFKTTYETILNLTPLDQLNATIKLLSDPTEKAIAGIGSSIVKGLTPLGSFVNQLAKMFDSTANDTTKGEVLDQFLSKVRDGIPGLANTLEDKEVEGNKIYNPDPIARLFGAVSKEQATGVQTTEDIKANITAVNKQMYDNGVFTDNIRNILDKETQVLFDKVKSSKEIDESDSKKLLEGISKGVTESGDTRFLEDGDYDSNLAVLKTKLSILEADPTTTRDKINTYKTQIKRGEIYKANKTSYDMIKAYEDISVSEWRDMGDPESEDYDPDMYQQLYAIDSMLAESGVSRSTKSGDKNKYSVKKTGGTAESNSKKSAKAMLNAINAKPTQTLSNKPIVKQATYKKVPIVESTKLSAQNKYAPIRVSAKSAKTKDKSIAI